MPYIPKSRRIVARREPANTGEMTYAFYALALEYLDRHGVSYQRLAEVIGALEGAKLELSRRVLAPHEIEAIKRNGDVTA